MIEIGRLHHCSIIVTDLEATRHFYCDILGMEEVGRPPAFTFAGQWFRKNGYEVHTVHIDEAVQQSGDPLNTPRPQDSRDITFARHFAFSIKDVDETVRVLNEHGIEIIAGPRSRSDGATQLYCYDPDGHMVEFAYEPWDWE